MQKILTKLHSIMSEVDYIQKDKTNTFQNYKYASEKAIKETLHALLVKHKVIFTVSIENTSRLEYVNNKCNKGFLTDLTVNYSFYDVESGEVLKEKFVGTGDDGADKGTYKAITGAIKYILTSTFLIPTGDDPEDEKPATPSKPVYVKQAAKPPVKPVAENPLKREIKDLCDSLNPILKKGEYEKFVETETNLILVEQNYPQIIKKLKEKAEVAQEVRKTVESL